VQISKDQIMSFLQQQGQGDKATQAQQQLPDQVDTDQHGDLLAGLGIDVPAMLGSMGGAGGIGKKLGL
jgi:hypothetical protein